MEPRGPPRWLIVCETAAVPRRTVLLASSLARRVELDVFCWSRRGTGQIPGEIRDLVSLSSGRTFLVFMSELARLLRRRKYDGVVVADLRILAGLLLTSPRTRIVYDRMEIPTVVAAERVRRLVPFGFRLAVRCAEAVEAAVAARCDLVLTIPIAGPAWNHVRRLNPRSRIVPNWPSIRETVERSPVRDPSADGFTVAHTGAVSPATGLHQMLEAMALIGPGRGVRLVLVGYLVGVSMEALRRRISKLELGAMVEVIPRVPYADLRRILTDAHVGIGLLDPSDSKFAAAVPGMSRKVFTYMAAGLPVVSNDATGEWLEAKGAGIAVSYGSPRSLADALLRLRDDPTGAARMGATAVAAIRNGLNWETIEGGVVGDILGSEEP